MSFWVYYAVRRRLAETKPFIWFYQATYYLFVQEGVYELPSEWRHADFRCIVWTFVDSDQSSAGVPEVLVPQGTRLFAICHISGRRTVVTFRQNHAAN